MAYTPNYYYPNYNYSSGSTNYNAQQVSNVNGIMWVDGEIGAKAYQMPYGVTGPIALWDTNDQVIYVKSWNSMGIPNPLQKLHYTIEEQPPVKLQSGDSAPNYATKEDLIAMKDELKELVKQVNAQKQGGNRT